MSLVLQEEEAEIQRKKWNIMYEEHFSCVLFYFRLFNNRVPSRLAIHSLFRSFLATLN